MNPVWMCDIVFGVSPGDCAGVSSTIEIWTIFTPSNYLRDEMFCKRPKAFFMIFIRTYALQED